MEEKPKKLTRAEKREINIAKNAERQKDRVFGLKKLGRKAARMLLEESEVTPLGVMMANMTFWHKQSERMAESIQELVQELGGTPLKREQLDRAKELKGMLKEFLAARENAQRCAVDAAPYMHPKLQSVKFEDDDKSKELIEVTMALTLPDQDKERDGEQVELRPEDEPGREYRRDYVPVQPVRRTDAA